MIGISTVFQTPHPSVLVQTGQTGAVYMKVVCASRQYRCGERHVLDFNVACSTAELPK